LAPRNRSEIELLLDGTVDCLMLEATPTAPAGAEEQLVPVYPDVYTHQREYYARTHHHPAVHVIAVRREAVEERPELLTQLCEAFDRAKAATYSALQNERLTGLPFMRAYLDDAMSLSGDDPGPYGLDQNWAELHQVLTYAHDQGLTGRRLEPEELFDPPARDFAFQARMRRGAPPWTIPAV
jgi:4,5-dihydroxyphthalate decarboxylase